MNDSESTMETSRAPDTVVKATFRLLVPANVSLGTFFNFLVLPFHHSVITLKQFRVRTQYFLHMVFDF